MFIWRNFDQYLEVVESLENVWVNACLKVVFFFWWVTMSDPDDEGAFTSSKTETKMVIFQKRSRQSRTSLVYRHYCPRSRRVKWHSSTATNGIWPTTMPVGALKSPFVPHNRERRLRGMGFRRKNGVYESGHVLIIHGPRMLSPEPRLRLHIDRLYLAENTP